MNPAQPENPTAAPTAAAPAAVIETDAVVIGAGPVGLFQVFQLGLLGLRAHVVDTLPGPGGQCAELYPDKPIYDIPALPLCTGRELAERLMQQVAPFQPSFHWGEEVSALQPVGPDAFELTTGRGTRLRSRVVFIAAGVGSFQPRKLLLEGAEALEGHGLQYRPLAPGQAAGQQVLIVGDDDAALEAAIACATASAEQRPASVTLMHRRDAFRAAPATVARLRALCSEGAMRFVAGQPLALVQAEGRLSGLQVATAEGQTLTLPVQALVVLLGLSPKLGPIANWGLALERKQVPVDTEKFETAVPGLYAVGDINTYPGKRKLIVSGFHEATLAAYAAAARLAPEGRVLLQYTTTSPLLQQRLGVLPGNAAPAAT